MRLSHFVLLFLTACSSTERSAVRASDSTSQAQRPPAVIDSSTPAPDSPRVVFVIDTLVNGNYLLDPIALIDGRQLTAPPIGEMPDSAADTFRHTFYGKSQRYQVLVGGVEIGRAIVGSAEDPGCVGLAAEARIQLTRPVPRGRPLFATNATATHLAPSGSSPLTAADREIGYQFISRLLADSGVPPGSRGNPWMVAGARVEIPGSAPLIAASLRLDSLENGNDRVISVFLVLDSARVGYRPSLVSYHNGLEAEAAREEFLDAIDIDGSGSPVLISRTTFYESYTYTVYHKVRSTWQRWYVGGDGGC